MRACLSLLPFLIALAAPAASRAASPEPRAGFFEQLSALEGKRDARVATVAKVSWYGDSGVISDGYTGELRTRLQQRFGDAGPGFVLASATFDDYLRDGVRMKRQGWEAQSVISGELETGRYGYGGVVATSFGGATVTYEMKGDAISEVEVWYQTFPKGGVLQLFIDGAGVPAATQSTRGDQIGDKVWRFTPDKPAKVVKLRAGGEGLVRVYGVVLDRGPGVQLDAVGILGMRARRWLNADKAHLEAQVGTRAPDLLVLNFGGNERVDGNLTKAAHKADLEKALAALKAGAPGAACVIVAPIAHGTEDKGKVVLDPALETIYEAQRELAKEKGCAFFDTLEAMGGKKALKSWRDKKRLSGDYAHLTNKGHEALGQLISEWLLGRYDAWRKS